MEMQIFENEQFGKVRTVSIDGETWFVGRDVAQILGYLKPENAIAHHVDKEDKTTTLLQGNGTNYKSKTLTINESGFYCLVLSSKMPLAKKFRRWVTDEILPSIREKGYYQIQQEISEKVSYYDTAVAVSESTSIRVTAKILQIPERLFTYLLEDMGYAYRVGGVLVPTTFMQNNGFAVLKEYSTKKHSGIYTHFTLRGRIYLLKKIKNRFALK